MRGAADERRELGRSLRDACTPEPAGRRATTGYRRASYDAAGRQTKLETGVGTAAAATVWRATYTETGSWRR